MVHLTRKPWKVPGFDIYSQQGYKRLRLGYRNHKGEHVPPELTKGLEWEYYNARVIIYNLELLESFFRNRQNPAKHLANIQAYLAKQQQSKYGQRLKKPSIEIA